ncbi:hypothetical protein HCN44_008941 [Aphidius gifuensis]|uniref:Uncharacterized protein n=1 Tax=Aphidius gifuensis TaxID=684658 RepID=A0A834XTC6_APHGI|nr:receptor-binding cancer antigen expressed on SiSo cells-like [Aphidius gifuensis]KAF7991570.1 hypothetical protein HCN44_008941 [Aphidius gifuensis]
MALEFLINRLKALVVIIMGVFRRALCCLRRRRRSSCDSVPLSAVGVVPNTVNNNKIEQENWDQWDDNSIVVVPNNKPVNIVQSKIEQYRQQIARSPNDADEPQVNYFQDMTPRITKQKKILLTSSTSSDESSMNLSKFAVAAERLPTKDLEVWDDNAVGWEEETSEEFCDPTHELREQRRRERERRLYEQHQKRMEYNNFRPQPLGEKITS